MGPAGQTNSIDPIPHRASIGLLYILVLLSYFSPRYLRNIPCTKILDFGMQTSYFPISEISIEHFFLSNIPQIPKCSFWAGYSPIYGYDPRRLHPRLFLHLSIGKVVGVFLVFLVFFLRKRLFFCILAQILYDICNFNLYVLNFYCHSFWMSSFWFVRCSW